ncbi:MAG TPA: hypothetical protein VFA60_14075, partial [Terriglobales bacterium]|nr:hypothetical protein [Terriglobales bacterium]
MHGAAVRARGAVPRVQGETNMAFDFTHLPGGGGDTGPLVTGLDAGVNAGLCVGLLDALACLRAVVDVFLLIFDEFFGQIFSGRPKLGKDSATDDVALFFIPSPNPVIKLWGMGIRILEAQGIPLSTSNPTARQKYIDLATAVRADLVRQFGALDGAKLYTGYAQLSRLNH